MTPKRLPQRVKRRPAWLRALGDAEPPPQILIDGQPFVLARIFKHDSWAATSEYRDADGRGALVKINRCSSLFGLPLRWLGRRLAERERRVLRAMRDVPGIPCLLEPVSIESVDSATVVARQYIEGGTLEQFHGQVSDNFFQQLDELLSALHRADIAYVDMNKADNVLVGEDGRPHLIDYQIHLRLPSGWLGRIRPARAVLRLFQQADRYHLTKHALRYRPDLFPGGSEELDRLRPWYIRLHRRAAAPLQHMRRRLLVWLGVRDKRGRSDSEMPAGNADHTSEATVRQKR